MVFEFLNGSNPVLDGLGSNLVFEKIHITTQHAKYPFSYYKVVTNTTESFSHVDCQSWKFPFFRSICLAVTASVVFFKNYRDREKEELRIRLPTWRLRGRTRHPAELQVLLAGWPVAPRGGCAAMRTRRRPHEIPRFPSIYLFVHTNTAI